MALTVRLSEENQKKLALLSMSLNMSQSEMMNLLVAAVDQVELQQMQAERLAQGAPRARIVRIKRTAGWSVKI